MGGTIGVIALLAVRTYLRYERNQARQERQDKQAAVATLLPDERGQPPQARAGWSDEPWTLPPFPPPAPPREIEPGVMFSEITLTRGQAAGSDLPGHTGKLWLYLPGGQHGPKSLPCILIAGAGSNLITGMDLGDGDRPEHLPYVRSGFAVLAYELDGMLPEDERGNVRALRIRAGPSCAPRRAW